jgi:hypothetical protein
MKTTRRTSIDSLGMAGFELAEEHLSLASGGARYWTNHGTINTYTDNSCDTTQLMQVDSCP